MNVVHKFEIVVSWKCLQQFCYLSEYILCKNLTIFLMCLNFVRNFNSFSDVRYYSWIFIPISERIIKQSFEPMALIWPHYNISKWVSNTTFAREPVCSPMFWWEPRLIVGAQLERVSWAARCICCDLHSWMWWHHKAWCQWMERKYRGRHSKKMMLESLPESRKSGNGRKIT